MKKDENSHNSKNESSMKSASRDNKKKKEARKNHSIKTSIKVIIWSDNDSSRDEDENATDQIPSLSIVRLGRMLFDNVVRIFTNISLSLSPRQCPDRYPFRAGQNLPDEEFRYLRTVPAKKHPSTEIMSWVDKGPIATRSKQKQGSSVKKGEGEDVDHHRLEEEHDSPILQVKGDTDTSSARALLLIVMMMNFGRLMA
ncbi:hypothetical protein RJ639_004683 [Escallonia herrerae]|uniref:Uncharacterized protein n=1 Tax=Escallonia herrerae TaxID=1293975 RepID=A0AA88W3M3_9ASTE|nr:hypothetical protein RJ639_004683 [Escallonia herrerae]